MSPASTDKPFVPGWRVRKTAEFREARHMLTERVAKQRSVRDGNGGIGHAVEQEDRNSTRSAKVVGEIPVELRV